VKTQTVLGEYVDGVSLVELAGDIPWYVEVADDDKTVAYQHNLVEHVKRSVKVDMTVPGGF